MKKYLLFVTTVCLCLILSSCETLSVITEKISSIFPDNQTQSTETAADKTPKKSPTFEPPADYEKAYSYRTNKPDALITKLLADKKTDSLRTSSPDDYVKTVCGKISENSENDFQKVKMAHDVVCKLVSYDAKNFWADTIPDQNWKNVLTTKTAVCEGYANLFKHFCDTLKVPCNKVSGYARGVGLDLPDEKPSVSNHAWNIVKIEDYWYLIDTTWDSGYMNGKQSYQAYSTSWLFIKPEQMLYSHFPGRKQYQLIELPLTAEEFHELPNLRPNFFDSLTDWNINFSSVTQTNSSFSLSLDKKPDITFSYRVKDYSTKKEITNAVLVQETDNKSEVKFLFPKAGSYEITIFYGKIKSKSNSSCGSFIINASEGSSLKYPVTYSHTGKNLEIITPQTMPLQKGESTHFEIKVSNKSGVSIIMGKTFVELQKTDENLYSGDVFIPANVSQVQIGLLGQKGNYEIIASYNTK